VSSSPRRIALPSWLGYGPALSWVLLLVSTAFGAPKLVDAVSGGAFPGAWITEPVTYLLGAPLFGVWDALTLLPTSQHYAVVVTLAGLYVGLRMKAPRGAGSLPVRVGREALRGVLALLLLLGFYAAGLLLPRPMVGLELSDPDVLSIDFHSHTAHSHDGWSLFSAARDRSWHEAGGFDVAYVTDHYTWAGVEEARPANPARVGERTALLAGAEIRIHRRPTNVLGERARYRWALGPDTIYMEPDSLRAHAGDPGPPPTLLYTMPGQLQYVVPFTDTDPSGVVGIEISDGSPRGLEQTKGERADIIALADSFDLALVAAANLHGWGRTVAAWSVLRLPGWQEMTPEEVAAAIERELHGARRGFGAVVERRMPYHGGDSLAQALTLPWLTWEHFRMLSGPERISWALWLAIWVGFAFARRTRASPEA